MWCYHCGQDVPQMASSQYERRHCLRCGKPISPTEAEAAVDGPLREESGSKEYDPHAWEYLRSPMGLDQWEIAEQLRHIGRILERPGIPLTLDPDKTNAPTRFGDGQSPTTNRSYRVDGPHSKNAVQKTEASTARISDTEQSSNHRMVGWLSWLTLLAGLTAVGIGLAFYFRLELIAFETGSIPAIPITLWGTFLILFSLTLQIGHLARVNRQATRKLDRMARRLKQLANTPS